MRRRLARRLSGAAACMLPGAVLVSLPKCPLCLAAWLTVVTGASVPAAWAAGVRGVIAVFWVAAGALAAAQLIRRRAGPPTVSTSCKVREADGGVGPRTGGPPHPVMQTVRCWQK